MSQLTLNQSQKIEQTVASWNGDGPEMAPGTRPTNALLVVARKRKLMEPCSAGKRMRPDVRRQDASSSGGRRTRPSTLRTQGATTMPRVERLAYGILCYSDMTAKITLRVVC